jgi:hypothetical protein
MKRCNTCKQEKARTDFYKLKTSKDGLNGQCKECYSARIKKWRKDNPEKRTAHKKKWRADNPEKVNAMQRRAGKNDAANLTDGYVRKKIVQAVDGLTAEDIPDIMVELKRNEIKIERILKIKAYEVYEQKSSRGSTSS